MVPPSIYIAVSFYLSTKSFPHSIPIKMPRRNIKIICSSKFNITISFLYPNYIFPTLNEWSFIIYRPRYMNLYWVLLYILFLQLCLKELEFAIHMDSAFTWAVVQCMGMDIFLVCCGIIDLICKDCAAQLARGKSTVYVRVGRSLFWGAPCGASCCLQPAGRVCDLQQAGKQRQYLQVASLEALAQGGTPRTSKTFLCLGKKSSKK